MALGFSTVVNFLHVKNVLLVNVDISFLNYTDSHLKEFHQGLG